MKAPRMRRMSVGRRTITFASAAMIMTIYGQTAGVSVFVDPLLAELGLRHSDRVPPRRLILAAVVREPPASDR